MNQFQERSVTQIELTNEQAGHADLASEMTIFGDRWQLGVEVLARDAQAVAKLLSFAAQDYLRADADDTATINKSSGMLEGPSDPAAGR